MELFQIISAIVFGVILIGLFGYLIVMALNDLSKRR